MTNIEKRAFLIKFLKDTEKRDKLALHDTLEYVVDEYLEAQITKTPEAEMTERLQHILLDAVKTCGLTEDNEAYWYIEESLYLYEATQVKLFLEWLQFTHRPFGRDNAQQRWDEFNGAEYEEIPEWYLSINKEQLGGQVILTKEEYEEKKSKIIQRNTL